MDVGTVRLSILLSLLATAAPAGDGAGPSAPAETARPVELVGDDSSSDPVAAVPRAEPAREQRVSSRNEPVGPVGDASKSGAVDGAAKAKADGDPEKTKIEKVVAELLKKDADKKKAADEEKKKEAEAKKREELFGKTCFRLEGLFDSHSDPLKERKKWFEKISIRGYTQVRFGRALATDEGSPALFGDRSINGSADNFSIRRLRLIFYGDINDHVGLYIQPDFASTPQGATNSTFFAQLRDAYADIHLDTDKVHRFRVGLSKVPYGFENMQSSQNRVALDRTDPLNSAVAPNERDLGVFYYWTPVSEQKLFKALVDSGLKGSGNYGILGFGVYDGQGGAISESNLNLHLAARYTRPFQLANGQILEASIQGLTGAYVVSGSPIRPLGQGAVGVTPTGTGGRSGLRDERAAVTFVWYPQPLGFQVEWQTGRGPALNDAQTAVIERGVSGGYVMAMYRHDTCGPRGIITPYARYQQYEGGYRNIANAPYGHHRQLDLGVEWQFFKELELVVEFNLVNTPNFTALDAPGLRSYRDFEGSVIRAQLQFNY